MLKKLLLTLPLLALAETAFAEGESEKAFPGHRVVGNVYYVGSKDLACYLTLSQ